MAFPLNPVATNIRTSLMFHFLEKAKEMERQGLEIIHLEKGEPELGPPPGIIAAAKRAMDEGHNILTPGAGIKELRDAIAEDLEIEYGIAVDPATEVAVVPGAKFGIYAAIASTIAPGDEVLCLSPFFPPHREIVEMLGGKFVPVPILEGENCGLSIEKFEERMTARTRFLLLNYPHNPTGWVPTMDEIALLRNIVVKAGLMVISDEVYDKIIFDGLKHKPFFGFPELADQLVLANSYSKRFAMTGWRIGYCVGPRNIINGIVRVQQNTATCANSVAQKAAVTGLKEEKSYSEMLAKVYGARRNIIIDRLRKIPGLEPIDSKGSLYVFFGISKLPCMSTQFADDFLAEEHVALTPGAAFGDEWNQYIRISMTEEPDKISKALDRLERFVKTRR